ncbi:MAG: hypothetical protein ACRC14_04815 [Paracoccaceae bacterium]
MIDYLRAKDHLDPLGLEPARRAIQNPLSCRDAVKAGLMVLAGSKHANDKLLCDKARVILWPEYGADLMRPEQNAYRLDRAVREMVRRLEWLVAFVAGGVTGLLIAWVLA